MQPLSLPTKISISKEDKHKALIVIEPCAPGYGTTLGNSLRRVLLSSLPGAAATSVKIKGVTHEFSTLPHVKEDVVELILNIKNIRFRLLDVAQSTVTLKVRGEKVVTAKEFDCPSDIEIASPAVKVATLTDKNAELEMEITVQEGRGYVPIEAAEKKSYEHGIIALDALYSPVRNANFTVENVRVGQMTNFDKVTMSIATDGSVDPLDALKQASAILVDHFSFISTYTESVTEEQKEQAKEPAIETVGEDVDEKKEQKKEKKKVSKPKKDK